MSRYTFADFAGARRQRSGSPEIWFQVCPSCGSRGWNVYANTAKGVWYCQKEGQGGRLEGVGHGTRFELSHHELHDWPTVQLPESGPLGVLASAYLLARGIGAREARSLGIAECEGDGFEGRVLIPYWNTRGEPIGWTARAYAKFALQGNRPKYVSSPGGKPLYQVPATLCLDQPFCLVEGPFDAIAVSGCTGVTAVAMGGKTTTVRQRAQLRRQRPSRLIIMLDGDATDASIRLARELWDIAPVHIAVLPRNTDPASADKVVLQRELR